MSGDTMREQDAQMDAAQRDLAAAHAAFLVFCPVVPGGRVAGRGARAAFDRLRRAERAHEAALDRWVAAEADRGWYGEEQQP